MTNGQKRFDYFIGRLQPMLITAAKQKNPALWLYRNNARTPLFMLEGLCKLHAGLHNEKRFTKMKAHFKLLEDGIGAVDYYDTVAKDLAANKKIPKTVISYLHAETREKLQHLNEILTEKKWIGEAAQRLHKMQQKLRSANWMDEKDELQAIEDFYGSAVYDIIAFVSADNFHFDDIENDVHELRRKLRWLSIYPQALRGAVQLAKNKKQSKQLAKYATKDIVSSPFNTMPDAGDNRYLLLLDANYFYALSWMIAELGKLKDDGLHAVAVIEALQATEGIDSAAAEKKAYRLLGKAQQTLPALLQKAAATCTTYFAENNLEHLVVGVRRVG
jgi:DNA repair exonuclease SbcCD ATPase subunit